MTRNQQISAINAALNDIAIAQQNLTAAQQKLHRLVDWFVNEVEPVVATDAKSEA